MGHFNEPDPESENLYGSESQNAPYQTEHKMKRRSLILLGVFVLGVGLAFWTKVFDWFFKMLP